MSNPGLKLSFALLTNILYVLALRSLSLVDSACSHITLYKLNSYSLLDSHPCSLCTAPVLSIIQCEKVQFKMDNMDSALTSHIPPNPTGSSSAHCLCSILAQKFLVLQLFWDTEQISARHTMIQSYFLREHIFHQIPLFSAKFVIKF